MSTDICQEPNEIKQDISWDTAISDAKEQIRLEQAKIGRCPKYRWR